MVPVAVRRALASHRPRSDEAWLLVDGKYARSKEPPNPRVTTGRGGAMKCAERDTSTRVPSSRRLGMGPEGALHGGQGALLRPFDESIA